MVRIGKSDIEVFPLNLGGNVFGWTADEQASFGILDAFMDGGGNFIDTADVYSAWVDGHIGGESETILGNWMAERGNRDRVVIATKVGSLATRPGASAANIAAAVEDSLARLRTDYIDLYYVHRDDLDTPLEETLGALNALTVAGKVRTIGASNFAPDRLKQAVAISEANGWARFEALQPPYSLVNRGTYEGALEAEAVTAGISTFTYSSLASGFLTGKYRKDGEHPTSPRAGGAANYLNAAGEGILAALDRIAAERSVGVGTVALAWIRQRPSIAAPIASASSPDQVPALLASVSLDLSAEDVENLNNVSSSISPE